MAAKEGIIEGEVKIASPKSLKDVNWVKGTAVRIYPVIAEPYANLTLLGGNSVKWTGKAKEDGTAFFNITFDENSYTKEYAIDATGSRQTVNFLSSTPITFNRADSALNDIPIAFNRARPVLNSTPSSETESEKPPYKLFSYKPAILAISGILIVGLIIYYRKFKKQA